MKARAASTLLLAIGLVSCVNFKNDAEDAKKAQTAIKAELGIDSSVAFRSTVGTQGATLAVVVHMNQTPSGNVAALKSSVSDIVNRSFRAHVDKVAIDF
jgi:hypothetical protein